MTTDSHLPAWCHTSSSQIICTGEADDETAADLSAAVAEFARRLQALNLTGQHRPEVLTLCADRYNLAAAVVAVWLSGGQVALPPNTGRDTIREIARGTSLLLHDGQREEGDPQGHDLRGWRPGESSAGAVTPPSFAPDAILATLYTSGSRDAARAHRKTAGQLLGEARMLADTFLRSERQGSVLSTVPAHHIYGLLFSVLAPLAAGVPFVRETPFFPESVAAAVAAHQVGYLVSVPAHLRSLEALDDQALPSGLVVFSSGAPLRPSTAEMLHRKFGLRVREVLGSTETGGIAHRLSPPGGLWTPLPGVQVDADEDGTLLLGSPFTPPDGPSPWVSADRIRLRDRGFEHLGRTDDVVKIAGKRVDIRELERWFLARDDIKDAAVSVISSSAGRQNELRAAVVLAEHAVPPTTSELRTELKRRFDPVVVPRVIRVVKCLPRTSTGKIRQTDLHNLLGTPGQPTGLSTRLASRGTNGQDVELQLEVPDEWEVFEGHFPGHPIVPGAAQLETIVRQCATIWPDLGNLQRVTRLKFAAPLRPGARALARLQRKQAHNRVHFELRDGETTVSSGVLSFTGAQPAER